MGTRAVVSSLVASVASFFFQLRALDLQLEISKNAPHRPSRSLPADHCTLGDSLHNTSQLDVRQAEQLVTPPRRNSRPRTPHPAAGKSHQHSLEIIPARCSWPHLTNSPFPRNFRGLPSALLSGAPNPPGRTATRRLQRGIGRSRAANYPQFRSQGSGGLQSDALTVSSMAPRPLSFGASLSQPIFTGEEFVPASNPPKRASRKALLVYQQTISILSRRSDSLIAYKKNREFREQQELLTASAEMLPACPISAIKGSNQLSGSADQRNQLLQRAAES